MSNNNVNLNQDGMTDDIFSINILESTIPETKENLSSGNPELKENFGLDVSINVPAKTEISEDVYNKAIDDIKKSFNEAFDTLKTVRPVAETVEDKQMRFTESAIMESYCSGPYYESATKENKEKIKDAVAKIKDIIDNGAKDNKYSLKPISVLSYIYARAYVGSSGKGIQRKWTGISKINPVVWQMCGVFFCHENETAEAIEHYKQKFADQIGDLTFNAIKCGLTLPDFYGKKAKGADGFGYILVVDTKREDVKEVELPTKEEVEAAEETK
jgi:hypothetical protein